MPHAREDFRIGTAVSVLVHILVLVLLLMPLALTGDITPFEQGAGGAGPAGGGGGSSGGDAMRRELLKFVRVAPAEPAPPKPTLVVKTVSPPPIPVEPTPTPPQVDATATPSNASGTGPDQGGGAGPGSGGGVGSGVGTGRGSSIGPGTGGGAQENFPPTPDVLFMPPTPYPASVRGSRVIVEFDVDASGRVLSIKFEPTRDRGYNRRFEEALRGFHFRPGHRPDGTPIRMKYQMTVELGG
jgi:protein TonB